MKSKILAAVLIVTVAASVIQPQAASALNPSAPLADLVTTNDNNQIITYSGTWAHETALTGYIQEDRHVSSTTSDYAELRFFGIGVSLYVATDATLGQADIYIDNVLDETIDLYSASPDVQVEIYSAEALEKTYHTIKVVVKGTKNESSSGYGVDIDAFRFIDDDGMRPQTNEIQCAWGSSNGMVCTQVDTQHITITGTDVSELGNMPTWVLNASGIGSVYTKASGVSVHWWTNPWSGSGDQVFNFDVKREGGYYQTGADRIIATVGTYYPNGNGTIALSEYEGDELVNAAGTYQTGLTVYGAAQPHYQNTMSFVLAISTVPFDNPCIANYNIMMTAGPYVIAPTIETPLGPAGSPPDEMIYPVASTGEQFMIRVGGDGWHDGTATDLWAADYSWDGVTWMHFSDAGCKSEGEGYYKYTAITTPAPEGTTGFYIRATDDAGDYGNNYMDANEKFIYTISIVWSSGNNDCSAQFTYDDVADLVGQITVPGYEDYVEAASDLVPGDWYIIEIASGAWQQDGTPPDRYDAQFSWGSVIDQGPDGAIWNNIAEGGSGVYCATTDGNYATIRTQADASDHLYLRVADEANSFDTNTGALTINVYHATFQRTDAMCELNFDQQGLIGHSVIQAAAESGLTIGISAPEGDPTTFGSVRLEPGAWYMLETTDGPWAWVGGTHSDMSYEVAVKWGGEWVNLADWSVATCNVAIDALGHRRLYFQTPATGSAAYTFRVDDSSVWFNNQFSMGIDLYGAYSLNDTYDPGNSCDYVYDSDQPVQGPAPIFIDAALEEGEYIGNILDAGTLYAFVFEGNDIHWHESGTSGDPLYAMQVSDDGGTTWHPLPEAYGPVLCYMYNGNQLTVFWKAGFNYLYNFRVDSESFGDNGGGMNLNIYAATIGDTIDPWVSCLSGLALHRIPDTLWIPVDSADGKALQLTDWYQADASNPDTEILGFAVEITNGPWDDAETDTQHYDAELSSDNGATWYPLDRSNPDIECAQMDFLGRYATAYFQWTEDQNWKIRVNDEDTATFTDNTGNLGYTLYAVTGAMDQVDCVVDTNNANCIPADVMFTYNGADICAATVITPAQPEGIDVPAWLAWVGGWIVYAQQAMMQYLAWCPKHTAAILSLLEMFKNVEPIATLNEINIALATVKQQLEAYDWSDTNAEESDLITASGGGDAAQSILDRLFPGNNPWEGGPLIVRQEYAPDTTYSACVSDYGELLNNDGLITGVCFVSSMASRTGVYFILNLMFTLGAVFMFFRSTWANVHALADYMAGSGGSVTVINDSGGDSSNLLDAT